MKIKVSAGSPGKGGKSLKFRLLPVCGWFCLQKSRALSQLRSTSKGRVGGGYCQPDFRRPDPFHDSGWRFKNPPKFGRSWTRFPVITSKSCGKPHHRTCWHCHKGVVHMVASLPLPNSSHPISIPPIISVLWKPNLIENQIFEEEYREFSAVKDKIKELSHQFNENIEKLGKFGSVERVRSPRARRIPPFKPKPKCSEHYSGHSEYGDEPPLQLYPHVDRDHQFS